MSEKDRSNERVTGGANVPPSRRDEQSDFSKERRDRRDVPTNSTGPKRKDS